MDVGIDNNEMHLSKFLVASLVASATLGLANPAKSETITGIEAVVSMEISAQAEGSTKLPAPEVSSQIIPDSSQLEVTPQTLATPSQNSVSLQNLRPQVAKLSSLGVETNPVLEFSQSSLAQSSLRIQATATVSSPVPELAEQKLSATLTPLRAETILVALGQQGGEFAPQSLFSVRNNPRTEGQPQTPAILAQTSPTTTPPRPTTPPVTTPRPATPTTPTTPTTPVTPTPPRPPETQVLVAEVVVSGAGELENRVYEVIRTQPGRTTTRSQLQEDVNVIAATGLFNDVEVIPADTPLGVRLTFAVKLNPLLQQVVIQSLPTTPRGSVLPAAVVNQAFSSQYGTILNTRQLQTGISRLNQWYRENGYTLAQVLEPQIGNDGIVTLNVAEGVIEDIRVRFLNADNEPNNADGTPVTGRTRDFIITREVELKAGEVFNRRLAEADLQRVFGLGIFDDVRANFAPGQDPRRVVLVLDVVERNTGSITAGGGFSSSSGLFGSVGYQQQNLGGNNQRIGAEIQVGQRELLFDFQFTDPWIAGDPYRTSYNVNVFRSRALSLIFDGGPRPVTFANNEIPRILRYGAGVTFTRPLSDSVFTRPEWVASLGFQYQNVSVQDGNGRTRARQRGNPLSASGTGVDDLFSIQLGLAQDTRDNPLSPTRGSVLRLGMDQTIPIGSGSIAFNRLRANYSYYVPVRFTNFTEGQQVLAFNIQGGTVLGTLPPYEAFSTGGTNSVRGYNEGDVGSGRSYALASVEYRFPIVSIIGGALFLDAATDLGSGSSVIGNPAGLRGKPGSGYGYGVGIRVQSPVGAIRIDYGINDRGNNRIHFGIGERF